ncbi:MAG: integrase [Micavibrio sp.]|nr:integrase [Micavibrio sp.]
MKLSDIKIKNAKPADKAYKMFDGGGLYLEILPTGKKLWRLKYYFLSKEKRISLGAYPLVTLAEARDAREDAKKLLLKDIDPSTARKDKKVEASRNAENTFKAVALEWHDMNKERWSKNYAYKVLKGLELNVFPFIGHRPIKEITPPELLNECLRRIEKRGSLDIAGRTKQICGQVFRYAIQTGRCEWNAAENLQGALKTKKTEHFRTIDWKEIPDFLKALDRNEARLFERTRRAVYLSLFTFCRPKEIRMARWEDIDFESKQWTIPASLMKSDRDHIVPLSNQAIEVLQAQHEEIKLLNTPWVFPSQIRPREPMSDGTVNKAIKRLGYGKDMVAHGFRALARTTIRERLGYDSEVIEKQLAHKTKNPLGEAYDRTQFLETRVIMMQDWADFVDGLASGANVLHFRKAG